MTRSAEEREPSQGSSEEFEVRCPVCKQVVKVSLSQAEREMIATCPKGHDVPLVKAW